MSLVAIRRILRARLGMAFELIDVLVWYAMGQFFYWRVAHATPWGRWTPAQRRWYERVRSSVGAINGPSEAGWGTIWIFSHGLQVIGAGLYFRYISAAAGCSEGLYIAVAVLAAVNGISDKIWEALFFDTRNFRGALILAYMAAASSVAVSVLVAVAVSGCPAASPAVGWVAFSAWALHSLWWVYLLVVNHVYAARFGAPLDLETSKRLMDNRNPFGWAPVASQTKK